MNFPTHFISARAADDYARVYRPVPAPCLRRSFVLKNPVEGELVLTGLGFYRVWINGREITRGHMAPYISNPDQHVYYDRYDLTGLLRKGENVIAVLLGNGMQNNWGGFVWEFDKVPWRGAPKMACCAKIKEKDGTTVKVESNTKWKTHDSPIVWDDERLGEFYDARHEIPGWNNVGFDDSSWARAESAPDVKGEPHLNTASPIAVETELKPISVTQDGDAYIYDFGVNYTGLTRLKINGTTAGQMIEILHGEYLEDGHFYGHNLYFNNPLSVGMPKYVQKTIYICAGRDEEIYMPSFTYAGFRYARITGITPEQATPDLLTYVVMHSDLKSAGGFTCSNEILNKLQEMTLRSDLSNFWYFPTDCPHREKNGWTGDAAVSAQQFLLNLHAEGDLRQWLQMVRTTMHENGGLPGIIPTHDWGYDCGPCWDWALTLNVYYIYQKTGDKSIVKENADAIKRQIAYFRDLCKDDGLVHRGLGDWCSPQHPSPRCSNELVRTIAAMVATCRAADLFDAIGRNDEAKAMRDDVAVYRKDIREKLMRPADGIAGEEGQACQALALHYGLFNANEEQKAFDELLRRIDANDGLMDVGMFGVRVIFHVLTRFGRTDLAMKLILDDRAPSYGAWVRSGLTSLAESPWGVEEKDFQGMAGISSLNHHFLGDISHWFISVLGGIVLNPTLCNANSFVLAPHFPEGLDEVSAWHEFPAGKLEVKWTRKGDTVKLTVNAAKGLGGELQLADGVKLSDGKTVAAVKDGVTEFEIAVK